MPKNLFRAKFLIFLLLKFILINENIKNVTFYHLYFKASNAANKIRYVSSKLMHKSQLSKNTHVTYNCVEIQWWAKKRKKRKKIKKKIYIFFFEIKIGGLGGF